MNYACTEEAFRKLICCFRDKLKSHKHHVVDIEGLDSISNSSGLKVSWDEEGNVTFIEYNFNVTHDGEGNVMIF